MGQSKVDRVPSLYIHAMKVIIGVMKRYHRKTHLIIIIFPLKAEGWQFLQRQAREWHFLLTVQYKSWRRAFFGSHSRQKAEMAFRNKILDDRYWKLITNSQPSKYIPNRKFWLFRIFVTRQWQNPTNCGMPKFDIEGAKEELWLMC